jgi:hypothetical protein
MIVLMEFTSNSGFETLARTKIQSATQLQLQLNTSVDFVNQVSLFKINTSIQLKTH